MRAHCEKCCDDKIETPEVWAERIRDQRCRGHSLVALQGSCEHEENDEEQGQADCLVTEMLQCLPMEAVYWVTHWFEKRFMG